MIAKIIPFTRLPHFIISRGQKREISFFDYKVPKELEGKIKFGQIVEIYFRDKKIQGLIVGLKKTSSEKKLKEIKKIIFEESLITGEQFKLIKWLASYYFASLPTILKTSLPKVIKLKKSSISVFRNRDIYQPKIFESQPLKVSQKFIPTLKKIVNIFEKTKRKKFLLYWDEPIKKMAFYYAVIKKTLEKNQKILILVPEIDQINFILKYLYNLTDEIAILHSKLKKSELWFNWQKILDGEMKIIIGTRMAVFAPIKNLGLIILEDEENNLYHSEQFPYYDARTIAWKMTKLSRARLIFSSQAPRVETYWYTFGQKKFLPFDLRKEEKTRFKLIDMVEEMRKGNFSPLSDDLKEAIINAIKKGKKIILYLKRKGFATFNFCQDCGYLFSCPRCDLPLTAHKKNKIYYLYCHHCGYEEELPLKCPACQGVEIKMKGLGIQKIGEILTERDEIFKKKVVLIDESTKKEIEKGDIIVTTIPFWRNYNEKLTNNFELIGLINADVMLNQPDFRSFEKTFQELVAISNWSKFLKINLIIQTWSKDNYAIQSALNNDFKNFYWPEIETRKEFSYPPFRKFFKLTIQEKNWKKINKIAQEFEKKINLIRNKNIKIFPYHLPPRRKIVFEKSYLIKIKDTHPLSPLPDEIKKIFPENSFLEPVG